MHTVRGWQALLTALGILAVYSFCWWWSGYSQGYAVGSQTVVDQYQPRVWALCQTGWRWERCAKLEDGTLVLFRGLR